MRPQFLKDLKIDFMGRRREAMILSVALILISIVAVALLTAIRFRLPRFAPRRTCRTRRPETGAIDSLLACELQELHVEGPEPNTVVEVAQVRELVAEGVDEARVLERPTRRRVHQPDADGAVGEADAVAPLDVGALRLEHAIGESEARADPQRVPLQTSHQLLLLPPIHALEPPATECGEGIPGSSTSTAQGPARLAARPRRAPRHAQRSSGRRGG